jgi:uncharacterized protein
MQTLTVRHPAFDFTDSDPVWGDHLEAVSIINSGAIIPAPIERYLIRVMRRARKELDPTAHPELVRTLELFNKQEGQHLKLHAALTDMLRRTRYPRLGEFEEAYEADLEGFLAERPLDWNLAYCEGFESTGCAMAEAWVDGDIQRLCEDHGSVPMQLWMWHLAEEFEHRSVVHDVIGALYPDRALGLRSEGARFNRDHIAGHTLLAAEYVLGVERAAMTPDQVARSEERSLEAALALAAMTEGPMRWVFEPDYDPAGVPAPRDYEQVLTTYPRRP